MSSTTYVGRAVKYNTACGNTPQPLVGLLTSWHLWVPSLVYEMPGCFVKKRTETNPLDIYIGKRIKEARIQRGIGQAELANSLTEPVTFQQIQKYERGANRLSVSRLWEFAETLKFPYEYFLPDSKNGEQYCLNDSEIKLIESFRNLSQSNQEALSSFLENIKNK